MSLSSSGRLQDDFEFDYSSNVLDIMECILYEKDYAVEALGCEVRRLERELKAQVQVTKKMHPLETVVHVVDDHGTRSTFMGRCASQGTNAALKMLPKPKKGDEIAQKIIAVVKQPELYTDYLASEKFARDLRRLCRRVAPILEAESRCVFLQSPVYVFGDIHGNLEDLNFFADNIWKLGMNLTAGQFLFLGDYVDRGKLGLECLAYLFALKIENPKKLYLLRGNHELRDVNGWTEHYKDMSFIWQCQKRFGKMLGEEVWDMCNQVFDRLPIAAVIDNDIFCTHGGIPRPIAGSTSRIESIMKIPAVASVCPPSENETAEMVQVCSDCLWADPAKEMQERKLDRTGFGESFRGGGAICFGNKAIDDFFKEERLNYIIRAHEAHSEGVAMSKGAKVLTVFSTSKDHGQSDGAMCGCVLVDQDRIVVINRSAKYKNKYVHHRGSTSLLNVSMEELEKRLKLGLIFGGSKIHNNSNRRFESE